MACNKCGSSVPCGCKDGPFTTVPSCACLPDPNCPVPQICVEFIDQACVYQNDYSIVDTGFPEGASMAQLMQMISLFLTNEPCINPASACQSSPYVYPYQITKTSIAIAWVSSPTATSYQVEYIVAIQPLPPLPPVLWTLLPPQSPLGPNTAVIVNLLPNTAYLIRVKTMCGSSANCYSVTLRINTKP